MIAAPVVEGDYNAELDFWDALAERPVVSNDDGLHGMLLFADGFDPTTTYEQRLQAARDRNLVPSDWNEPPDLAMQRGAISRAVAVCCKIEGGVMMRVLGPHPRYAFRELQYLGMMGAGSEQQALSGREFMGIISKAQDYLLLKEAIARRQAAPSDAAPADVPDVTPPTTEPPADSTPPSAPPTPLPGPRAPTP